MTMGIKWFYHCVKSVRSQRFSGPYFAAFGLNTERYSVIQILKCSENTDQKNSEYRHISRSVSSASTITDAGHLSGNDDKVKILDAMAIVNSI